MLGFPVICYLFLGGFGGGLCVVCCVISMFAPADILCSSKGHAYGQLLIPGYLLSFLALTGGMLCLLADLGRPELIERLITSSPFSYINIGAWALALEIVLSCVLMLAWARYKSQTQKSVYVLRALSILGMIIGFVVIAYTGLFLYMMKAVPLWHSVAVPVLFVASSLACGVVAVELIHVMKRKAVTFKGLDTCLVVADVVLVSIELVCCLLIPVAAFGNPATLAATQTQMAHQNSVTNLLYGEWSWLWWAGFVGLGIVVPVAIDAVRHISRGASPRFTSAFIRTMQIHATNLAIVLFAATGLGAFAMRTALIFAGTHPVAVFG